MFSGSAFLDIVDGIAPISLDGTIRFAAVSKKYRVYSTLRNRWIIVYVRRYRAASSILRIAPLCTNSPPSYPIPLLITEGTSF